MGYGKPEILFRTDEDPFCERKSRKLHDGCIHPNDSGRSMVQSSKKMLEDKINDALDRKDREKFMELSKEYAKWVR